MQYKKINNAKSFLQSHEKFYNNILKNINIYSKDIKEHLDYLNSISSVLKLDFVSNENLKSLLSKEGEELELKIKRKKEILQNFNDSFVKNLTTPIRKNIKDYKKEIFTTSITLSVLDMIKSFDGKDNISKIPSGDSKEYSSSGKWSALHKNSIIEKNDIYLSIKRFHLATNTENNVIEYSIIFRPVFIEKGKSVINYKTDNFVSAEASYYIKISNSISIENINVFDLSDYNKIMKSYGLKSENFNSLSFMSPCSHSSNNKIKIFDDYQTNIEDIKESLIKEIVDQCS